MRTHLLDTVHAACLHPVLVLLLLLLSLGVVHCSTPIVQLLQHSPVPYSHKKDVLLCACLRIWMCAACRDGSRDGFSRPGNAATDYVEAALNRSCSLQQAPSSISQDLPDLPEFQQQLATSQQQQRFLRQQQQLGMPAPSLPPGFGQALGKGMCMMPPGFGGKQQPGMNSKCLVHAGAGRALVHTGSTKQQ